MTSWTFLSRFSQATVDENFWKTAEFWYFATGALVMFGWFWSGLLQTFFLYLYVLGHELTHAVFVLLYRGKVTDFHVSADGGYITTNKTNLVIALSPYFVPFWAVVCVVVYAAVRYFADLTPGWDRLLFAVMGVTWTFHMVWTLWMIPRDQPDLKENGTFLSLVIIYLANLLVLAGLLCVAADSPLQNSREFAMEWLRHAATWGDMLLRWGRCDGREFPRRREVLGMRLLRVDLGSAWRDAEGVIYLDANATTPLLPEVLEAMLPWLRDGFANPSGSYAAAKLARRAIDRGARTGGGAHRCAAGGNRFHRRWHGECEYGAALARPVGGAGDCGGFRHRAQRGAALGGGSGAGSGQGAGDRRRAIGNGGFQTSA